MKNNDKKTIIVMNDTVAKEPWTEDPFKARIRKQIGCGYKADQGAMCEGICVVIHGRT